MHAAGAALAFCCAAASAATPSPGALHVPSPDWRDQVLYFLMIDRFDDGDPSNNDQHAAEYDPADGAKFQGGDLRGVQRRVPYLRDLGFTGVWITPPVANQWWNPAKQFGGYHGYWATDFSAIDAHFGTRADYIALSRALHAHHMVLVQDIVVNHVANFLQVDAAGNASLVRDTQGRTAPVQAPFDRNDPRDPAQKAEAIYHWTPDIRDFSDTTQLQDWQLAGLDDLNTENPVVQRALRKAYGDWIREAGVDGFRVDTAFHVPPAFFRDFLEADDARAPGVLRVARDTGRQDFLVFGEGFALDKPFDDTHSKRIEAYVEAADGMGMIDFPLYGTANDVFARGAPTAQLADRIQRRMQVYSDPWRMPTFVDNHDVDRFLAGGDEAGLKQALLMLMTLPGIPVVWQGTEQGFKEPRAAMFAGDHFKATDLSGWLQLTIAMRRGDKVFTRGTPTVLRDNAAGPGILAYRMQHAGRTALVVFNTAPHVALLDAVDTGLAAGTLLQPAGGFDVPPDEPRVGAAGLLSFEMPPRSAIAWIARTDDVAPPGLVLRPPTIEPLASGRVGGDFTLRGTSSSREPLRIVVDDDLARAVVVRPDAKGRWEARIDTGAMIDPGVAHAVVAWDAAGRVASARRTFHVARPWTQAGTVDDPLGDDTGPHGNYAYPAGGGYEARQGDIEHVAVSTSGGALRVAVRMRALTTQWNPPNGFDHVAFNVFVEVPDAKGGARDMPLLFAPLPDDMRWHYRLRAHGWSNAAFAARGASATNEGAPSTAAAIATDAASRTVTFTIPAAALGNPRDLQGARIYVSTWDYDGGWRALAPMAAPNVFGGGDPARDARVLDAVGPIRLP